MTWTTKNEERICNWLKNCKVYYWLHTKSRSYYEKRFNCINIPIIIVTGILSIVTGIGSLIVEAQTILLIIACIVNAIIGALSFYLTAYKPSKVASMHDIASKDYQKLVIELEHIISMEPVDRPNPIEYMSSIADRITGLISNTPNIHQKAWNNFNIATKNGTLYKEIDPGLVFLTGKIHDNNDINDVHVVVEGHVDDINDINDIHVVVEGHEDNETDVEAKAEDVEVETEDVDVYEDPGRQDIFNELKNMGIEVGNDRNNNVKDYRKIFALKRALTR